MPELAMRTQEEHTVRSCGTIRELISVVATTGTIRTEERKIGAEETIAKICFYSQHNGGPSLYKTEFDPEAFDMRITNISTELIDALLDSPRVIKIGKLVDELERLESQWNANGKLGFTRDIITRTYGISGTTSQIVTAWGETHVVKLRKSGVSAENRDLFVAMGIDVDRMLEDIRNARQPTSRR